MTDTTPLPSILRAEQAQRWNVGGALSELVDNSFGPGRGNANRVWITHDTARRTITVLDDGRGMEAISRLFRLGDTIGRAVGDIGMYGAGGTKAVLWLARKVEVWTLRDRQLSYDVVDWPHQIKISKFPNVSDEWQPASVANTPPDLLNVEHGTLIRLHLANERSFFPSNVKAELARTYAPGLRHGKELSWTTIGKGGGTQPLSDPLDVPHDKGVSFDITLQLPDGTLLPAYGRIGIIDGLPQSRSHVSVAYGPRVILRTRDCYASPDGCERYSGSGVAGWLDLGEGWQPYLSTTKDAMNDLPVWETLMAHVFNKIRPLLKEVETEKLYLELVDLGISLEKILDGHAHVEVNAAGKKTPSPEGEERAGTRRGTDEPDEEKPPQQPAKPEATSQDGDDTKRSEPAKTRLEITHASDATMNGCLCSAHAAGETVLILVNEDHEVVQTAMKAKPINRMALNLMAVSAIASTLVDNPDLQRKTFPRHVLRELDGREDDRDRERFIVRMLMDRAVAARAA